MSRAKEIQEKLALQTKLQEAFNNNNSKILSWLNLDDKTNTKLEKDREELTESKHQFFNLPVIQQGTGIGIGSHEKDESGDIHTIGDFITSDKKVASLSKKKRRDPTATTKSIHRVSKNDTKAMVALKRKMRDSQRKEMRDKLDKPTPAKQSNTQNDDDFSEGENDAPVSKFSQKKFGLMFDGAKKRKK